MAKVASQRHDPDSRRTMPGANLFQESFARILKAARARNDSDLARALGITPQSVKGSKDKGKIPPSWITAISKKFHVSADWILYGEGPMKRREKHAAGQTWGEYSCPIRGEAGESANLVMVPKINARLNTSTGSLETTDGVQGRYAFRSEWIRPFGRAHNMMVLMDIAGDCMEPELREGDTVLIDQAQKDIIAGRLYAIGIDEQILIKYVDKIPGKFVLRGKNTTCPPIEIDFEDKNQNVRVIGRVVWWCRTAR